MGAIEKRLRGHVANNFFAVSIFGIKAIEIRNKKGCIQLARFTPQLELIQEFNLGLKSEKYDNSVILCVVQKIVIYCSKSKEKAIKIRNKKGCIQLARFTPNGNLKHLF